MYPRTDVELNAELPSTAEFWTPEPDDIDEEGFGYFRDVWAIVGVPEDEARQMLHKDRAASFFVSELASTEAEFDAIARVIETGVSDYAEDLSAAKRAALGPYIAADEDDPVPLDGLDVGVAGLVYALSAAGAYPAASCRGHHGDHSWSHVPVVLFAIDRCRANVLAPLVREAGCGFEIDTARAELLVVYSASIEGTIALAEAVIGRLPEFRACDESHPMPPDPFVQPSLFDEES
ncbi:MAG: hypothetical protein ACRDPY_09780 [Streptosporangiaceae bacterium]